MGSLEQEKPKLTYENVKQIIQERMNLMDEEAANISAEKRKKKRGSLLQRIKNYFNGDAHL